MFNLKNATLIAAATLAPMAGSAATVQIDSFSTVQGASAPGPTTGVTSSTIAAAEAIGGFRTISASGDGTLFGFNSTTVTTNIQGQTVAQVSNSDNVTGTGTFFWDAMGADLTDNGTNDTFVLDIISVDTNVTFALEIGGTTVTSASNSATGFVNFAFSDFGVLNSVGGITLVVSGPTAFDASFTLFGAEDLIPNPSAVPLPAGGLLLGSILLGGGFAARRKNKNKA